MVKVFVEDGAFKVKGTFDFGYIGFYKDDLLEILEDCSDIRDEWYDELSEVMDIDTCTDEEIAEFLTKQFNAAEKKIQAHIGEINDTFLLHIYDDMKACGREFWECEALTVPGFDYEDPDFDFYKIPQQALDDDFVHFGRGEPNNGTVKKDSFEQYLRKYRPMFNLDNFLNGIEPEHVCLHQDSISFQCSDKFNFALICGAYDDIDLNDLRFTDWHNY
jgi:hypothetical protein